MSPACIGAGGARCDCHIRVPVPLRAIAFSAVGTAAPVSKVVICNGLHPLAPMCNARSEQRRRPVGAATSWRAPRSKLMLLEYPARDSRDRRNRLVRLLRR